MFAYRIQTRANVEYFVLEKFALILEVRSKEQYLNFWSTECNMLIFC